MAVTGVAQVLTTAEKNWSYLDVALPGLDTFDPISPRWRERWLCVCGARHEYPKKVIHAVPSIPHSRYHAPVQTTS